MFNFPPKAGGRGEEALKTERNQWGGEEAINERSLS